MEAEKNSENLTELERRWSGFKQVNAAFLNMLVKNRSTDYIEVGKSAVSVEDVGRPRITRRGSR